MDLTLPLDYAAIERILPHRYPFLLVDRITELEVDKRIVGIKNVSLNERYLSHATNGSPVLPPTILTEAVAQVGAILILAKPENRQRLPFFAGIERVRYRRPVHPGDVVEIEANVVRLRSRMGLLKGVARVDGKTVIDGTMTFALGPPQRRTRWRPQSPVRVSGSASSANRRHATQRPPARYARGIASPSTSPAELHRLSRAMLMRLSWLAASVTRSKTQPAAMSVIAQITAFKLQFERHGTVTFETTGGLEHVGNHCDHLDRAVAARSGERLHDGQFHLRAAGHRHRAVPGATGQRPTRRLTREIADC